MGEHTTHRNSAVQHDGSKLKPCFSPLFSCSTQERITSCVRSKRHPSTRAYKQGGFTRCVAGASDAGWGARDKTHLAQPL